MSDFENMLGVGAEDPEPGRRPSEARGGGVDALAKSSALEEAQSDPAGRSATAALLRSQKILVDLQIEHFEEERRLAIGAAKRKRFSDRLRNGLQVFAAVVVVVATVAAAVMIHDAATSRSVVVDPFAAPPAVAPRGMTGEVVAAGVLDELQTLQRATRPGMKGLAVKNAWSSDVKIEVPQTGVSIGEIDRLLRQRLGHDQHIGGDLIQTETGGLALTVRGDGVPAKSFEGPVGDLRKLTAQAAEYVYGRSQPYQFATYLTDNNRNADALAFLPSAFALAGDNETRASLANRWGAAYAGVNKPVEAARKFRLAMALKPNNWLAWGNLVAATGSTFGEEAGWRESDRFLRAVNSAPRNRQPELRLLAIPAGYVWDLPLLLAANLQDATHNGGTGAGSNIDGPTIADTYGLMHDQASAARYMAQSDPDDPTTTAEADLLAGYAALDRGDPNAAVAPLEAFWKAWLADPNLQFSYNDEPCVVSRALGLVGRVAEAEAIFKRMASWPRCYAAHGEVLAQSGDLVGAERVWAEGLRIAPDLPHVYLTRGISEFKRGALASAAADLAAASSRAPHFADPLKALGDVLARQGRWGEAVAKYDAALKYAPAWPRLLEARAAALARHPA